ncbi:MAG TPA: response regulator [Thermoanaerobaculia bacterium]|nr:response regulator [Thermoanaerobaculia bacterium]
MHVFDTMTNARIEGTGKSILVVDDDLAIRVLLEAVLKRMNFSVELAEDGGVGFDKVRSMKFDAVLLDLMMPKVNGYEFLEKVKRDLTPGSMPPHIIVFTAAGQRGINKIPANSVCNSILKPFDLEKFIDMIRACVDGGHERAAATAVQEPA